MQPDEHEHEHEHAVDHTQGAEVECEAETDQPAEQSNSTAQESPKKSCDSDVEASKPGHEEAESSGHKHVHESAPSDDQPAESNAEQKNNVLEAAIADEQTQKLSAPSHQEPREISQDQDTATPEASEHRPTEYDHQKHDSSVSTPKKESPPENDATQQVQKQSSATECALDATVSVDQSDADAVPMDLTSSGTSKLFFMPVSDSAQQASPVGKNSKSLGRKAVVVDASENGPEQQEPIDDLDIEKEKAEQLSLEKTPEDEQVTMNGGDSISEASQDEKDGEPQQKNGKAKENVEESSDSAIKYRVAEEVPEKKGPRRWFYKVCCKLH